MLVLDNLSTSSDRMVAYDNQPCLGQAAALLQGCSRAAARTEPCERQFPVDRPDHHALPATFCAIIGAPVPVDSGIAPSTLSYRGELGK